MSKPRVDLVNHINKVSGWDNDYQTEVFCKKEQKLKAINMKKCDKCPYFVSMSQGEGVICCWEDIVTLSGDIKLITHSERKSELKRVAELIDSNIIKKG